jgi:hypothetical protein
LGSAQSGIAPGKFVKVREERTGKTVKFSTDQPAMVLQDKTVGRAS